MSADPNQFDDLVNEIEDNKNLNPDPNADPKPDPNQDPKPTPDPNADPNLDPNDESKKNQAFAAMRKTISDLKLELEELKKQNPKPDPNPDPDPDPEPNPDDDPEKAKLRKEIADLKKLTEKNSETLKEQEMTRLRGEALSNLKTLQSDYGLSRDEIVEFGKQASQSGYDLISNPQSIPDVYRLLNMDKIVASEVEKELKRAGINPAPGPGPTGRRVAVAQKGSIDDVLNAIDEKTKK